MILSPRKNIICRHVVFDENKFLAQDRITSLHGTPTTDSVSSKVISFKFTPATSAPTQSHDQPTTTLIVPTSNPFEPNSPQLSSPSSTSTSHHSPVDSIPMQSSSQPPILSAKPSSSTSSIATPSPSPEPLLAPISSAPESTPSLTPLPHHSMTTRLQDGTRKPKTFPNYKLYFSTKYPLMALHSNLSPSALPPTPTRFSQAMSSPH